MTQARPERRQMPLIDRLRSTDVDVVLVAALQAARELERSRWIPVTERLPERGVEHCVLTFDPVFEDHVEVAYLRDDIAEPTWDSASGFLRNVSHWMPLPAAPEDRNE